jgi:hypothetical protein
MTRVGSQPNRKIKPTSVAFSVFECICVPVSDVKVKQFLYGSGQALRVP